MAAHSLFWKAAPFLALAGCTAAEVPRAAELPPEPEIAPSAPAPAVPATDPRALIGTRWTLVEAAGEQVDPGRGTEVPTVEFGARSLGGHSGCNNFGTQFQIEGRRFVTSSIEANMAGCYPPVGTVEEQMFRALGSPFEAAIEPDGRLAIMKEGGPALRFVRVRPAPPLATRPAPAALVGTRWRLVEADGRRVGDDPAFELVTLDFTPRHFNGSSGCNSYSAEYRVQGPRLLPTPPVATQRGCGPPIGTLERRLFQILGAPFEVDADAEGRLAILSGGVPVLRFVPR